MSFSSWRKYMLDKLSIDLLNSNRWSPQRGKSALFEAIALMGKAFASPVRLELLDLLAQAPRSVEELARASGQSTANTSQHLQALHAAGLVERERDGNRVRYSVAPEPLRLWLALRDVSAARLAEVQRAAHDYLGDDGRGDRSRRAHRAARSRRRGARRRPARRGVRGRSHRRRQLDPARRARAADHRASSGPRSDRLLPRPVLRLRARGRAHAARCRAVRPPARGRRPRVARGRADPRQDEAA